MSRFAHDARHSGRGRRCPIGHTGQPPQVPAVRPRATWRRATLDDMVAASRLTDSAKADAQEALAEGRRRTGGGATRPTGAGAVLALQRGAGNAAVSALLA